MSWHFLQGQEEGFWEENSLDGAPSALLSETPTAQDDSCSDKMKGTFHRSPFGMTFSIVVFEYQCKMYAWTKNTDTAKRETASSAEQHLRRETRDQLNNVARMRAVAYYRHGKRNGHALSVGRRLPHRAQVMKRVPANVGRRLGSRVEPLTQWLMSGSGLQFSAALSSQDAFAIRQTEPLHCLGIQSRNCGRTLKRISHQACHGRTTERGWKNGA